MEKDKQDNALSDLSDVLGQLKGMALDIGSEIDRYVCASSNSVHHNLFHLQIGVRIQPVKYRTQAKKYQLCNTTIFVLHELYMLLYSSFLACLSEDL